MHDFWRWADTMVGADKLIPLLQNDVDHNVDCILYSKNWAVFLKAGQNDNMKRQKGNTEVKNGEMLRALLLMGLMTGDGCVKLEKQIKI